MSPNVVPQCRLTCFAFELRLRYLLLLLGAMKEKSAAVAADGAVVRMEQWFGPWNVKH